jgi:hypothetical protein
METQNFMEPKKRPTFLTVLCILSYVGVGIAIIGGAWNLITLQSTIDAMKMMADTGLAALVGIDKSAVEAMENWGFAVYSIQIISALICLWGVLLMWKLKKMGFYIYVIAEILPAVATLLLMGGFGPMGTMAMVMSLIFPIAFIVMYALNVKHME